MGTNWLVNELASVIWPLIDANISDQLPKLYLFNSLNRTICGGDMSPFSVSGASPSHQTFPGYYRGLRERWMTESRCYFFLSYAQKVGVRYPLSKKWGYAYPP